MKSYTKKREPIHAVQWTGEITPDVTELVGQRKVHVDGDRQLIFSNDKGPGRFVQVGDWIYSTSGEDLALMSDEQFHKIYEEVVETGGVSLPTDAEHEANAQALIQQIDVLLLTGLRLSQDKHPDIFRDRNAILQRFRQLLQEHAWVAAQREQARIREKITKELWP